MRIVAGSLRNRKIKVPTGLDVRPTTDQLREAVFNICQTFIAEGKFLDLFAGSGAMGIEALSRGAEAATFIDNNKSSIRCISENVKAFDLQDKATVLFGDVLKLLSQLREAFDIIYIDPPYDPDDADLYFNILTVIDQSAILKPGGRVFIEARHKAKIYLPLEGYERLIFRDRRRYGIAELFQFNGTDRQKDFSSAP
jgi:16S rRNA (guanine966-N2)-methyltransferase